MTELFNSDQFVWIVSPFMNQVTRRKASAVQKDQTWRKQYGHRELMVFQSAESAIEFILARAAELVAKKETELKQARTALAKLCRKYPGGWKAFPTTGFQIVEKRKS